LVQNDRKYLFRSNFWSSCINKIENSNKIENNGINDQTMGFQKKIDSLVPYFFKLIIN